MCRVISAFIDGLDMTGLGFKYAETKMAGRHPYDPAQMLKLYIYGYLNRVRSSRRLEQETHRNIEVMWLMDQLTPDDKTICNFRKDNAVALKQVFRWFSIWCNNQGLFGKELVAVDGSKFRANNSWKNIYTLESTKKLMEKVDAKIAKYIDELEKNDLVDEEKVDSAAIAEALKRLDKKKDELRLLLAELEKGEVTEISTVDPDARIMRQGGDGRPRDACYNVRTVTDSKNGLIVDFENSICANDIGSLSRPVISAMEIMEVSEITTVADSGFFDGKDFKCCAENGITCYVAKLKRGTRAPSEDYANSKFKYIKTVDAYMCPQGELLPYKYNKKNNAPSDRIYGNIKACKACSKRDMCTSNKRGWREIHRSPYQDYDDEMSAKMSGALGRRMMAARRNIVEHPYGTVKQIWGFKSFLCRSLEKTSSESALAFLAYNLRRVFNIFKNDNKDLLSAMT